MMTKKLQCGMFGLALGLGLGWLVYTVEAGGDGFKPLFNGKDLNGWKFELKKDKDGKTPTVDPKQTYVVKDGELQITGEPWGYVYTEKPYKNFVLKYDWTYPKDQPEKTTMNSGCLIWIQEPHKVWPVSIEPQCRYMDHGKLFFIGNKATENKFDAEAQKKALKPSHEWNNTEMVAKDGKVEVKVNGVVVASGSGDLKAGPIGFQSEGARIHFKNIHIKELP